MNWQDKTVLVTGGGGFLGTHILKALLKRNCSSVKIIGRSPRPEISTMGVEVIRGNIADEDATMQACSGCDIVFHTAAKAGVWGALREFRRSNVIGTANIIRACRRQSVPCLVNTSSPSVVCTDHDLENADEALPYPASYPAYYPATKAEAEQMVSAAADNELRTVSLRPHLIWGKGDPHILPRLCAAAKNRKLMIVGDGNNRVDMTHVENAAYAHIIAAEALMDNSEISGKKYFISDDAPVCLWEWINNFLKDSGFPPVTKKISYRKAYTAGFLLEQIYKFFPLKGEPPMTRFVAAQFAHSHYFNISAAKKDFAYTPAVDSDAAYRETVEWIRELHKTSSQSPKED